ncbi:unnamed protein product [Cyclocybe aegerita]|uniref:SUN domain-containing protein n=1 Tax=Cyclocybe aegerita TaxID=1973307 RepID=A0A8S0WXW0_CYCAE|nr:unnamed protein product [Cyclocybe aegerita]
MLSLLPSALLALLFASPALSGPTSKYDPFRALALQTPKPAGNPICCLKPQTPLEPVDDDILLSFEEWKLKQHATAAEVVAQKPKQKNTTRQSSAGDTGAAGGVNDSANILSTPIDDSAPPNTPQELPVSPQLRIPTTDRFNYASLDCSARVHTAHRSAKSPLSILSAKRDRYMLSPCNKSKEKQFVVVELCDDIRIDTIQLANFEFFSGVFKEFTVSVAKTSPDPDAWTFVGSYRAKNVRGVQTFRTPDSLHGFYRYMRIDFLSHYGSEYYCPVSLLRVYGLTHLEEWKLDVWQEESRAKQIELSGRQVILPVETTDEATTVPTSAPFTHIDPSNPSSTPSIDLSSGLSSLTDSGVPHSTHLPDSASPSDHESSPMVTASQASSGVSSMTSTPLSSTATLQTTSVRHSIHDGTLHSSRTFGSPTTKPSMTTSSPHPPPNNPELTVSSELAGHAPPGHTMAINHTSQTSLAGVSNHPSPSTPTVIVSSPSVTVIPVAPMHQTHGGESIYRTIINRVAAVENNQTLYMRYIEQQNNAIRDVIKRLGEDVGRLEGMGRARSLAYQRALSDWEKQRYQLQMDYGDLVNRIEYLSEEIVMEKRLGVAQLCLLLAVLVFLGLTRGSRPDNFQSHGSVKVNSSMREWGRRHFTLSNDWTNRFKSKAPSESKRSKRSSSASRTRTPTVSRLKPSTAKSIPPSLSLDLADDDKVVFPSSSRLRPKEHLETILLNTAPVSNERGHSRSRTISNPRSRAPSLRSTPATRRTQYAIPHRPITPTRSAFRPTPLQRSNSQGGVPAMPQSTSWGAAVHAPKSAKKWARSAHLHEVKVIPALSRRSGGLDIRSTNHDRKDRTPRRSEFEQENVDIFSSPPGMPRFRTRITTLSQKACFSNRK